MNIGDLFCASNTRTSKSKLSRTSTLILYMFSYEYVRVFAVLHISINAYAEEKDGLACKLGQPLPKTYAPPTREFKEFEVRSYSICKIKKLGAGYFGEVSLAKFNGCMN